MQATEYMNLKIKLKRLEFRLMKTDLYSEEQAFELAVLIYKGKCSLDDLDILPDFKSQAFEGMIKAALDELNQGDMFSSSETTDQGAAEPQATKGE